MSRKHVTSENLGGHKNDTIEHHENSEKPKRLDGITIATIILDVLTLVAICAAIWSTFETTSSQTENALLPIVVLAPEDDAAKDTKLVIRNIGFGPALNTKTPPITLPNSDTSIRFNHRTDVGANHSEVVRLYVNNGTSPIETTDTLVKELQKHAPDTSLQVCIAYENANRESFETKQTVSITLSNDLAIDFDSRRAVHVGKPCE